MIESLGSEGVRIPERLIRDLAEIGRIFLVFAVYTAVALFVEDYASGPVDQLYPFVDGASMVIFVYMIYRIVQLFSSLTTKKSK